MDEIKWLEAWLRSECNGDWEHYYGVQIGSLDNPGWWIQIDIVDTSLEKKKFETIHNYISDDDWVYCKVMDGRFEGSGDLSKLTELIKIFRNWAETQD